jgi:AcrR family transcriptional regulator
VNLPRRSVALSIRTKAPAPARKRMTADARREVIEQAATAVFAERGYRGSSVEQIARHSGVTVPVVYDHFASKQSLYERLIDRHYAELRDIWFRHADRGEPVAEWLGDAVDDWFAYVESHPFAGRMLFHDSTGDPQIAAMHRRIQARSRASLLPLVEREVAPARVDLADEPDELELAWETLRAVLQGLAIWWFEHPSVPRERIVRQAMNAVWLGLDRVLQGEDWHA